MISSHILCFLLVVLAIGLVDAKVTKSSNRTAVSSLKCQCEFRLLNSTTAAKSVSPGDFILPVVTAKGNQAPLVKGNGCNRTFYCKQKDYWLFFWTYYSMYKQWQPAEQGAAQCDASTQKWQVKTGSKSGRPTTMDHIYAICLKPNK